VSHSPLSEQQLAEIETRANAATPGPWNWESRGVWTEHEDGPGGPVLDVPGPKDLASGTIGYVGDQYPRGINSPSESMEFIAHARSDVPALVASNREANARVAELGEQLRHRDETIAQLREIIHNGAAR
jgi:hypothetical protein